MIVRFFSVLILAIMSVSVQALDLLERTFDGYVHVYPGNNLFPTTQNGTWPENWFALKKHGSTWVLEPATVKLVEAWAPSAKLKPSEPNAFFFLRGDELKAGPVLGTEFAGGYVYDKKVLDLNNGFSTPPLNIHCDYEEKPRFSVKVLLGAAEYTLSCQRSKGSEAIYLALGNAKQLVRRNGEHEDWQILWLGDIDRDGRVDFIDVVMGHDTVCQGLWVSSDTANGELVHKAARLRGFDC